MPATFHAFHRDMGTMGLVSRFNEETENYDLYNNNKTLVYSLPSKTVWRGWEDKIREEVKAAAAIYNLFS